MKILLVQYLKRAWEDMSFLRYCKNLRALD